MSTISWDTMKNYPGMLYLSNPFQEKIHRQHFPDPSRHYYSALISRELHEPPPHYIRVHLSTLHPTNILPKHEDPHQGRPEGLHNTGQKTELVLFHSKHSLKESICPIIWRAHRCYFLIADDKLIQKELDSLTVSFLASKCPLEIITCIIFKYLLHSCDILLSEPPRASGPIIVLPIVTPYSTEERCFSQSVRDCWYTI